MHDPLRRHVADAARRAGARTTGAVPPVPFPSNGKWRVVPPHAVPGRRPPKTLEDCVRWASWCAFAAATGLLDGTSVREVNRSLATLKDSFHKRDLVAEVRRLRALVTRYEQERARE